MPWNYRKTLEGMNDAKRRPQKLVKTNDVAQRAQALAKRRKDELIDILVELAKEDLAMLRRLAARFELETPPEELAAATRQAIADAIDFDERDINRNFVIDYQAYDGVKRNLGRLLELGRVAAGDGTLAGVDEQGSYQVEMSDEGMMTEDIEECLKWS